MRRGDSRSVFSKATSLEKSNSTKPPLSVVAKRRKAPSSCGSATSTKAVKEKISAIIEKSSAMRDHLPVQLLSVFGVPPALPVEVPPMNTSFSKSGTASGGASPQKSDETLEEMLRQIRTNCVNFSLETSSAGGASPGCLPVIAVAASKSPGNKSARKTPTLGSSSNSLPSNSTGAGSPSSSLDGNGRQARWSALPLSKTDVVLGGLAISPEAERIAHRILHVQLLLFPSTFREEPSPTPSTPTPQPPGSQPPAVRRTSNALLHPPAGDETQNTWARSALETPSSKRAWNAMFKKPRLTFPVLLGACRAEILTLDMCVAAAILTLLYNLLRATPQDQQKKVLRLCVKLGLLRICSSVLQVYSGGNSLRNDGGVAAGGAPNRLTVRARVCEAAGLLLGLAATFDSKVLTVARVSRGVLFLSTAADTYGSFLEQRVTQHRSLSDFDCLISSTKPASSSGINKSSSRIAYGATDDGIGGNNEERVETRQQERRATLVAFKKFLCKTDTVLQAFLHIILALNILSKSPANVQEMSLVVVGVTVKVFAAISFFLTQLCPKLLYSIATKDVGNLLRIAAHVECVGNANYVASFVMQGVRNFEAALFWSLTLLNRLCCEGPTAERCVYEANTHHTLRSLFKILKHMAQDTPPEPSCSSSSPLNDVITSGPQPLLSPGAAHSPTPPPVPIHSIQVLRHPRLVKASLHAFGTILNGDRTRGLKDLKEIGSLALLTQHILRIPEHNTTQWLHYFHHLCDVHGVCFIPAPPCPNPHLAETSMNLRVPLDILQGMLKLNIGPEADAASQSCDPSLDLGVVDSLDSPASERAFGLMGWNGVLLADLHPEWFTPELAGGHVESSTHLPSPSEIHMPWAFTEAPPPSTCAALCGGPKNTAEDVDSCCGDELPLRAPSSESIVAILKHHIRRLLRLPPELSDFAGLPMNRHRHNIVYERVDRRMAEAPTSPYSASVLSNGAFSSLRQSPSNTAAPHPVCDQSAPQAGPTEGNLIFASNFECGNLQRAVQVAEDEYDLVLSFDTATNSYVQWFCFSVANYCPGRTYRFNIVNMEKTSSTFNEGQRPLMLHVPAQRGPVAPRWVRVGSDIYYFPNSFRRPARESARKSAKELRPRKSLSVRSSKGNSVRGRSGKSGSTSLEQSRTPSTSVRGRASISRAGKASSFSTTPLLPDASPTAAALSREARYYTLTFTIQMPPTAGTAYLANCFPFSYTDLREMLQRQCSTLRSKERHPSFFVQNLCNSACGLPVPLITATSMFNRSTGLPYTPEEIQRRPVCLMTARVHPGESNSSWMMNGILDYLVSGCLDAAQEEASGGAAVKSVASSLLESFVFKVVPMLNVDGVVMGNHRCSIVGVDLNRDYLNPSCETNPVLFALKRLVSHMIGATQRHVVMGADFHGHSRAKNFLLYGCTRATLVAAFRLRGKISLDSFHDEATGQVCSSVAPEKLMPAVLSQCCPAYDLTRSSFAIQKSKANTNRVVMYREFGIRMSYGIEASMMGGRAAVMTRLPTSPGALLSGSKEEPLVWPGGSPTVPSLGTDTPVGFGTSATTTTGAEVETHYNQETYAAFGGAFMWSLHALLLSERDVNRAADNAVWADEETVLMRRSWQMLAQAGSGRAAPCDSPTPDRSSTWIAAPAHSSVSSGRGGVALMPVPTAGFPPAIQIPLSISQRREILYQLLRGSQTSVRLEDCELDGDDEEDDEGGDDDEEDVPGKAGKRTNGPEGGDGLGSSDSNLDGSGDDEVDDYDDDNMSIGSRG